LQKDIHQKRLNGEALDTLILLEHPPTITIGKSGNLNNILISDSELEQKKIAIHFSNRGGDVTYHGPGQLVAYPIIELYNKDIHWFVRTLLEVVSEILSAHGLKSEFKEGQPGIWVNRKKIASIGIAIRRWIAYHGIALNVNNDLTPFQWINPCGHPEEEMTSMAKELGSISDLGTIQNEFENIFKKRFGFETLPRTRHPSWLRLRIGYSKNAERIGTILNELNLNTVCQSACCPNIAECFKRGTATFMILGNHCTRACRFCAVAKGPPEPVDESEPERVAMAIKLMGLSYAIITSVTRDDLPDGGSKQFVDTINAIRQSSPETGIEILIPDFLGSTDALYQVCKARPDILNHNLETVPRLYPSVRPQAEFHRSLDVLKYAAGQGIKVKSGLMLGLGETETEIYDSLVELHKTGCDILTLGQYLSPSKNHLTVKKYIKPEEFDSWKSIAHQIGFKQVASAPLVRSSYKADELFKRYNSVGSKSINSMK